MKRLAILRHAKSSWDDPSLDDFNRPLNDRGWKTARRMGRELKHRELKFDLVLSSTAARARETIDGVQDKYDLDCAIEFEPDLYLASEGELLQRVRSLDEKVKSALLVGHNPGLEQLIAKLTRNDKDGLRRRIEGKFPTGALAVVELPGHHWSKVKPGEGEVVELILPKDLD